MQADLPTSGQPPDVAADASPNYNAGFLNGGLWIFNKDGTSGCAPPYTQTTSSPCVTMSDFWPNQTNLADPQIAWDPIIQRWIATTLSGSNYETLLFAYTAGDNPNPSNWTRASTSGDICPVTTQCPGCLGDEDILGYGAGWAAVDTKCLSQSNVANQDSILFISNSAITGGTVNSSSFTAPVGTTNLFGTSSKPTNMYFWRPSRDVSAGGSSDLFLAASVANGSEPPFVEVATVCTGSGCCPKKTKSGTPCIQAPIGFGGNAGNASDQYALPNVPIPGCSPPDSNVCEIQADDANITQVLLQHDNLDGNNYLLASFPASYGPTDRSSGTEEFWFEIQLPSENFEEFLLSGPSAVSDFPTNAMDQATDLLLTTQYLGAANPSSRYFYYQDFPPSLSGQGDLTASATYTGSSTAPVQRWGDYMSSLWDPSVVTTASSPGTFWTAQEYSQGGPDESTEWFGLAPALLAAAGSASIQGWSEGVVDCPTAPTDCSFTVTAPPGAQDGEMLVLSLVGVHAGRLLAHRAVRLDAPAAV